VRSTTVRLVDAAAAGQQRRAPSPHDRYELIRERLVAAHQRCSNDRRRCEELEARIESLDQKRADLVAQARAARLALGRTSREESHLRAALREAADALWREEEDHPTPRSEAPFDERVAVVSPIPEDR
jgi:chromosome segregation ATPase